MQHHTVLAHLLESPGIHPEKRFPPQEQFGAWDSSLEAI